ncbi:hypothetical protein NDU88_007903 [Pleurodeles waltl]|uniref:Uncharacterized protein n=1 Tax=Pleurodeles waltl TaxID=8319 RepID=A0AAV7QT69_PLEWA|nr:hypothetical protein NDU88_007903 [Pleurodeles waltl]
MLVLQAKRKVQTLVRPEAACQHQTEEREGAGAPVLGAPVLVSRENTSNKQGFDDNNIDWNNLDGCFGDGERPSDGKSTDYEWDDEVELDYEEDEEELEEGEIPHWQEVECSKNASSWGGVRG